jgi:hypothetical protein
LRQRYDPFGFDPSPCLEAPTIWMVTSIFHPELPHKKTSYPFSLHLKAYVAPTRSDFCKSHVSIRKPNIFNLKD